MVPFSPRLARIAIASYRIVGSSIGLLIGFTVLSFPSGSLQRSADALVARELAEDPNDFLALLIQPHLASISHDKTLVAVILVVISAIELIAGIGLARGKAWGFYVILGMLAFLFPVDAYQLLKHPTAVLGCLVAIHLLIVTILIRYHRSIVTSSV